MSQAGTPSTLPRELTDIPEDVRHGPAPVIPEFPAPYSLRPADPNGDDPALLAEWMRRPHLLETWDQPWSAERRRANWQAQLAGTYSRPCVLGFDFAAINRPELGMRDVAYIELYRPAKDEIARLYESDPHDMGFHIATADLEVVGRGVMSTWIGLLGPRIFAAEPQCRRVMGDPDHRNPAINRAFAKKGWHNLGTFDIRPDRRITLWTCPRTERDIPAVRA